MPENTVVETLTEATVNETTKVVGEVISEATSSISLGDKILVVTVTALTLIGAGYVVNQSIKVGKTVIGLMTKKKADEKNEENSDDTVDEEKTE